MFAAGPRGFPGGIPAGIPPTEFDLPHPPLSPRVIAVVHQGFVAAFKTYRKEAARSNVSLTTQGEDDITAALCNFLDNDVLRRKQKGKRNAIPGFDDTLIESIVRHSGTTDYSGTKLKKEPDLFIKLRSPESGRVLHSDYAIFVECKPVDKTHSINTRYCDDGLIRFVNGDYAWGMQEALMVGFVRHGYTLQNHLTQALAGTQRNQAMGMQGRTPMPSPLLSTRPYRRTQAVYESLHDRNFSWRWNKGPACPITVYHSWHDCS